MSESWKDARLNQMETERRGFIERIAELEAERLELVEALQEIKDARAGEGHDMCSLQEIAFEALAKIDASRT